MEKTHNCLQQIREDIMKADTSISAIVYDHSNIINLKDREKPAKTGQGVTVFFTAVDKAGKRTAKTKKTFIVHEYCPFCGQKYE